MLGTLAAFPLVRCTFRFKQAGQLLVILPMIIPHFLMGVALLLFFAFVKLPLSRITDHPRACRLHAAVRGADRVDAASTASTARSSAPPATSVPTRRARSGM